MADTAETFKTISILLAVGGAITFVILFAIFNEDQYYNDDEKNKNKITLKKLMIFTSKEIHMYRQEKYETDSFQFPIKLSEN